MEGLVREPVRRVSVSRHYISQKPSRIKWKPEGNDLFADHFVAGSWDNGKDNSISLWYLQKKSEDELVNSGSPICKQKLRVEDDVTDLKFVDDSHFVYTTCGGKVGLVSVQLENYLGGYHLKQKHVWPQFIQSKSRMKVSFNAVDSNDTDVITGSEDGRIALLSTLKDDPIGIIGEGGGSSIQSICFLRHNEIIAGDLRGLFRVWDLRNAHKPAAVFPYSSSQMLSISSAAVFPAQRHMFIGGAADGSVTVWDLRKTTVPSFVYNAHQARVTCIHYHHTRPSNMFTCAENGEIWHWHNFEKHFTSTTIPDLSTDEKGVPKFTKVVKAESGPRVTSIRGVLNFPVNSVDSNRLRLIGGSDLECVLIVHDLHLDH